MWRFFALVLPVVALHVPHFDIDLDLPPRDRWLEVTKYYKEDIIAMMEAWHDMLEATYTPAEQADWIEYVVEKSEEFNEELIGIYEALGSNHSFDLDTLKLFNVLYEMGSPTLSHACSGLLLADETGKVIHGRNMDYSFIFKTPDGTLHDWPDVTFEANFWKDGKRLFMGIQWPVYIGVHTAMRFNGWSFEQNTRLSLNDGPPNLEAGKQGGVMYGFVVRKYMETTPDFQTAVTKINATSFAAPQYFIMAGALPNEGAIISMDRLAAQSLPATPPVRHFGDGDGEGPWFLLETNDDANKLPLDPRRPLAKLELGLHSQEEVSVNLVWEIVHNFPLKNPLTVFTWVAEPSANYSQVVLRGQEPVLQQETVGLLRVETHETEEVQLLQRFLQRRKGPWTHVISDDGLRLEA